MARERRIESFEVRPERSGERLDRLLVEQFPGESRARLQSWIREGSVTVDGRTPPKAGVRVEAGQRIAVAPPPAPEPIDPARARARLSVIHEDEALVVVDKPAGLLTHGAPSAPEERGVAELADAVWPGLPRLQGEDRPGVVHRLDRDTSGLLVLARTEGAMRALMDCFAQRRVKKRYLALVHGAPRFDSDWIEAPIGRSPRRPDRQSVLPVGEGRPAETFYQVLERYDGFALLACEPRTGRTHQIRVHLASIDLPIVGDPVYRTRGAVARPLPREAPDPARQALHAAELAFEHPTTGVPLELASPLPVEIEALRAWLAAESREDAR